MRELFPQARVLVLSSDLVATVERLREELDDVAQGRFDIVIGTQLVAKGHHFPKLNLVGIVDADLGLANGDPRAAERTFQLLHQVVGRAGREAGVGRGYLQTHQPEHPVMRALIAQDREAFYAAEIDGARAHALSAVRPAREPRRLRRATSTRRNPSRGCSPRAAPRARRGARARPGRSAARRWCAAATACGCWSNRRAPSISRPICANGLPPRRSRRARSSSTSTSTRRAFCEEEEEM